MKTKDVKEMTVGEVYERLSSGGNGLSDAEAKKRLETYGPNQIEEKRVNPVLKFLGYFWGPIPWMIEVAAVLSITIAHWEDFWIITALLLLNAIVAFWQESKAGSAIDALKRKLAPEAKVKRDGKWIKIPGRDLVPGDIVRVRSGDIIPADIKFIEGDYASVDESALTGESMPVDKHTGDLGYDGAVLIQGEMNGIVVTTGMQTYFGKTAGLVENVKGESHFQKAVVKIANYLIVLASILVVIIFLVGIFRHESILKIVQFALVLTVASIPVALPAVLSVTLAVGAIALAKKNAIVSRLTSIEEMAGMDILCSDKTGTITTNRIVVTGIVPMGTFGKADVVKFACMASNEENQDTIDNAIFAKAGTMDELKDLKKTYSVIKFKPFDPVSKRTEADVEVSGGRINVAKGAAQAILDLVNGGPETERQVGDTVADFAQKGYRALAVAVSEKKDEWKPAGILAMEDPPRGDSAETVKSAQEMGITVKMVTGDRMEIAANIATQVNLGNDIVPSEAVSEKSDREAIKTVEKADGFAQVFPEHKYHIVELLQKHDHIVGMTGDGVNDAPALKKADVGIAVEGATDAAKSAASIVFTKPGLSVIIDAVKRSREIFQRMTHYSIYRITETIRILLFVSLSILIFNFYPVTALMIVLLALLNDAPIMTIAYDNVSYSRTPDKWNMKEILGMATFLGVIGVLVSFLILFIGKEVFRLSNEVLQSFIYLKLSVFGHFTVFVTRTKGHFWTSRPALPLVAAVILTQLAATLIAVYGFLLPAMGWQLAGFIWGTGVIVFLLTDFIKVYLFRLLDHRAVKMKR
ncbi:MAG: plasma-membrane proton-efflux P-type ATPase [Spirochaetales bacterium]|nr:plasma-membrane proton-efflux P-type ATPase [Spirochaetales bacterium]